MIANKLDIGRLLREEKRKRGLTYEDIGIGVSSSSSYIYRVSSGTRQGPSYNFVQNLINFLGLNESDLLVYRDNVTDIAYQKAKVLDLIGTLNTRDFGDIVTLVGAIEEYQEVFDG